MSKEEEEASAGVKRMASRIYEAYVTAPTRGISVEGSMDYWAQYAIDAAKVFDTKMKEAKCNE